MSLLIGAIALLVQATVVVEIDSARSHRLAKKNSALTARQVGHLRQHPAPQFVLGCRIVDEVESFLGLLVRRTHGLPRCFAAAALQAETISTAPIQFKEVS